jgi:hypothetical protein
MSIAPSAAHRQAPGVQDRIGRQDRLPAVRLMLRVEADELPEVVAVGFDRAS